MGRFEFVPGVEKEESPIYTQAHDGLMPQDGDIDLFR